MEKKKQEAFTNLKINKLYNGWLLKLVFYEMKKVSQSACVCWEKNILNLRYFFLCSFTISLLLSVGVEG